MKSTSGLLLLTLIVAVAACVPQREPPPQPQPRPRLPVQPPPPPPPPPPADWRDLPLTNGNWTYFSDGAGSQALFGVPGSAAFSVRCERAQNRVTLVRDGIARGNVMTVRTSFGARNLPVAAGSQAAAAVPASDRFLDTIVFSRGRFTIEVSGLPMLVIPSWPEPARVIEDCRG
jgi:hypothetical protein